MKKIAIKSGLAAAAAILLFLASCPNNTDDSFPSEDNPIDEMAGVAKAQADWGTLSEDIPNNIGNAITANPKTTRTITWQSKQAEGEVVMVHKHFPSKSVLIDGWYFHRVDITGLTGNKTYHYIAGCEGAYSPVYSFKTESIGPNGFSILHITDPQLGTGEFTDDAAIWKRVIEKAVQNHPDAAFVVNTGDIVDNKDNDRDENFDETGVPYYFDYAQETIANFAFAYSMGNNDLEEWYNKYFYTPENGNGGILYSFDYGNVHFVNIDSNVKLTSKQLSWLENDLKNTKRKWKVAITHQADNGRTHTDTAITKLFDWYYVDLVLAGHNHFYARSKPIDSKGDEEERNDKGNGAVWTIPNAAGSKFNPPAGQSYLARDDQPYLPVFSEIWFDAESIKLWAYTVDGDGTVNWYDYSTIR